MILNVKKLFSNNTQRLRSVFIVFFHDYNWLISLVKQYQATLNA